MCLIGAANSKLQYGLLLGGFVLLIHYPRSQRQNKYFIESINIQDDKVSIKYLSRDTQQVLEGDEKDFVFKKKMAIGKTRTPYMIISYKGELKIRQFEIEDWRESKFDEVIAHFWGTA